MSSIRVRLFDTDGIDAFVRVIRAELDEIFPDYDSPDYILTEEEEEEVAAKDDEEDEEDEEEEEEEETGIRSKTKAMAKTKKKEPFFATLQKRISRGSDAMLYFEDFTQEEIYYDPAQGPRYDVLAVFMVEFNSFISSRFVSVRFFKKLKYMIHA